METTSSFSDYNNPPSYESLNQPPAYDSLHQLPPSSEIPSEISENVPSSNSESSNSSEISSESSNSSEFDEKPGDWEKFQNRVNKVFHEHTSESSNSSEVSSESSNSSEVSSELPSQPAKIKLLMKDDERPLSKQEIYDKLLSYQLPHVLTLIASLDKYDAALDGSDMGTGKTYCAVAIAAILGYSLFVVCPLSVISTWRKVAKIFRVKVFVINYDSIKIGKYFNEFGVREKCPYIEIIDKGEDFIWTLPAKMMLAFDEIQKCKNPKTKNSKLLTSAKKKAKTLMLSGTVANHPQLFASCAYVLDLCSNIRIFNLYLKTLQHTYGDSPMIALHKKIYPDRGHRLKIADLGDLFPKNQVIATTYTMGDDIEKQIQEQYLILSAAIKDLKNKEANASCVLEVRLRIRQKVEALKILSFVEMARDDLENDRSVAIFVNFVDSMSMLADKLGTDCLVHGQQSLSQRDYNIEQFQSNKSRLIILQIQAGGTGISLHDIIGPDAEHPNGYPRSTIISPPDSAENLAQALSRTPRANGKTPCQQRIVFCANTIEEKMADNLQIQLNHYAQINDGKKESKINLLAR